MPTPKCACGPQVPYDYSLGMASRQFNKPRCPCTKCKSRVREAQIAMGKQVASNAKAGICGQCINGLQIGNPAMAGPGGLCQGCSTSGPGQSQRQLAKSDPGMGMLHQTGCNDQQSKCGRSGQGRAYNQGQVAYMKANSNQSTRNISNFDKGVPTNAGENGGITFAGNTYGRQSSTCRDSSFNDENAVSWQVDDQPCDVKALMGLHGDSLLDSNRQMGRDTLGRPIDLHGTGVGSIGMCSSGIVCDENCGYGTGCDNGCRKRSTSLPGGASNRGSDLRGPVGVDIFGNEQMNCFLTFFMETLGILVFFAICTITFWITLGYYIVQLIIDLKNADRYVQIAVAIIVGLLVIAFCITLVTNNHGSCCRNKEKSPKVQAKVKPKPVVVKKATTKVKCSPSKSVKTTCCKKKATACTAKKVKPPVQPNKSKAKCSLKAKPKMTLNLASLKRACKRIGPKARGVNVAPCRSKGPRYTDCQGRAIFQNSRRYAIPTEMKQPPAIVIWLRDLMCRLFRR